MIIKRECPMCHKAYQIDVDNTKYEKYFSGNGLLQNIFPELNSMEREFIKTGYCPACQNLLFGSDYESDIISEVNYGQI